MRISLEWLKDFIELNISPEELIRVLNSIGLVVDEFSWEEAILFWRLRLTLIAQILWVI